MGPRQNDAPPGAAEPRVGPTSVFGYEPSQVLKLLEVANNEALRQRIHGSPFSISRDSSRWKTSRYHTATGQGYTEGDVDANSSDMLSLGTNASAISPH